MTGFVLLHSDVILARYIFSIDTIKKKGVDWVKDLGRKNVEDLLKIIEWNERNYIRFMRMFAESVVSGDFLKPPTIQLVRHVSFCLA